VPAWRAYLVWDGKRWNAEQGKHVPRRWAQVMGRRLMLAVECGCPNEDLDRFAKRCEGKGAQNEALELAGSHLGTPLDPADLDPDPYLLNVANGVVDLHSGEMLAHDRKLLQSKIARASYDQTAAGPTFEAFLRRVQPDEGMRGYLQRLLGYSLTGRVIEHVLPVFSGDGRNGKTTLMDAVEKVLGEYSKAVHPQMFASISTRRVPTEEADLRGRRLCVASEMDNGQRLDEAKIKRLTGGDRVSARQIARDEVTFAPSHTFVLLTNGRPEVRGTDEGIWRRLRLVPWSVQIPADEQDVRLPEWLEAEQDAILTWLVLGHMEWNEGGLAEPEGVRAATEQWRADSDVVGTFLREQTQAAGSVSVDALYRRWRSWAGEEGVEAGTKRWLTSLLRDKGYQQGRTNGTRYWRNLA
jgi:putative DNA primase/helicase